MPDGYWLKGASISAGNFSRKLGSIEKQTATNTIKAENKEPQRKTNPTDFLQAILACSTAPKPAKKTVGSSKKIRMKYLASPIFINANIPSK